MSKSVKQPRGGLGSARGHAAKPLNRGGKLKKPIAPTAAFSVSAVTKPKPKPVEEGSSKKAGSKQTRVLTMLESPAGASLSAIMEATGWQQHSVRGFLAGVVRKRLGLELISKTMDGTRIYQIVTEQDRKPAAGRSKRRAA